MSITNIFEYVKKFEWDKFEKSLSNDIDFNIKDESKNYVIQYIIIYNNVKALKSLLAYDPNITWIDIEGKTILFEPIKYNYTDIILLLIDNDKRKIGESIVDIKDKYGNFPIHYALIFQNIDIFNILAKTCKLSVYDRNHNSLLHLIVKNKNINFMHKKILEKTNINIQNNDNYTALHLACVYDLNDFIELLLNMNANTNIHEKLGLMTPVFIALLNGNNEGVLKILNNEKIKYDINRQEIEGNTLLHLAIIENNYDIINEIIKKYKGVINFNITNKFGNTSLHIIFQKITNEDHNMLNYNMYHFIEYSDINIQNNSGYTCWHYIIKLNAYDAFSDILIKKKNNLFILNNKNKSPFDMIKDSNTELLDLISRSYYHILMSGTNKNWINDFDIKCSSGSFNENKCITLIKKYIIEKNKSFPSVKKQYCINVELDKNNSPNNFTGISLDVLMSYIFFMKKYSGLSTSITENFSSNIHVGNMYSNMGIEKNLHYDYQNFEILWIFLKFIVPTTLEASINNFIENDSKKLMAIPLGIDLNIGSHSNIIIIDKQFKTVERFEPNGALEPYQLNYNAKMLDFTLEKYFKDFFKNYKYLKPLNTQEIIGFQTLEMQENNKKRKIGDPEGFCVGWCLWYLQQRLLYQVHPLKLSLKLKINIKAKNISFKDLIRSFMNNILIERNKLLEELEIDINDIVNENISESQQQLLEQSIKAIINVV